jgi:DNA primase
MIEREALKLAIQEPGLAGPLFDAIDESAYTDPMYVAIRQGIAAAGGVSGIAAVGDGASAGGGPAWIAAVAAGCPDAAVGAMIPELAVDPPISDGGADHRYVTAVLARLQEMATVREIVVRKSKLQRLNPVESPDEYSTLFGELIALEAHARGLREQAAGGL